MNELKISGTINFKKESSFGDKIKTSFSVAFGAGKDKEGNKKFGYIKAEYWNTLSIENKDYVNINGYLNYSSYTDSEGNVKSFPFITVLNIEKLEPLTTHKEGVKSSNSLDDEIPF